MNQIKNFIKNFTLMVMLLSPGAIGAMQHVPPSPSVSGKFYPSLVVTLVCEQITTIQGVTMNGKLLSITFEEFEGTPFYQKTVSDILLFLEKSNQTPKIISSKRGRCI